MVEYGCLGPVWLGYRDRGVDTLPWPSMQLPPSCAGRGQGGKVAMLHTHLAGYAAVLAGAERRRSPSNVSISAQVRWRRGCGRDAAAGAVGGGSSS